MIKRFYYKSILLLLLLPAMQQRLLAQFEEGKRTITVDTISSLALPGSSTLSYSMLTGEVAKTIQNIICVRIDESSALFPLSGFTAKIHYVATLTPTITPVSTAVQDTGTLTLTFDTTTGAKNNVRVYKLLTPSERVTLAISSIDILNAAPGWDPKNIIKIENEMRVLRYYTLANNTAALTPGFAAHKNYGDAVAVAWSWNQPNYNNMTQVEWAWLENEMAGFYTQNGAVNTNDLFSSSSTRVDIDNGKDSFKIPLLYPNTGVLYYRVRAAMRKNDGSVITGPWSVPDTVQFAGHQPNLNWQSSTSFAENGKYKTVIQYFDGSLRGRQTVTKDNETGNTVVGETIYDLQGRPNVQILPTPTISNAIQYFTNFNRFQGQVDSTEDPARYFDLTIAAVKCNAAPALDITRGNGRYYSANNDWLATENKSKYIPDAQGYAYTETRFMDDATERVSDQGGVGINHQLGSGHETKYFYGKPSQNELDALFGTEVGDASHYSKNMVQDANGQMSVSYVDMHGRTIATALAGNAPANLVSIANAADYPQASGLLTNQLLTPANNLIKANSIESVSTLLVPAQTNYNFTYHLDPAIFSQYSNSASSQICFDCKYDLEISIRQENCANGTPIVKKYSNLQIVPANQACGTAMGFIGEDISIPTNNIAFSQLLGVGSWVVRKTLTINDSMYAVRKDSALKVFLIKSQQAIYDSIYTILSSTSGCGLPAGNTAACDSCNIHLGTFTDYKNAYLAALGNPQTFDLNAIQAQYTQDSLACAEACGGHSSSGFNTLANLRSQLLADMVPFSGQYAIDSLRDASGLATGIIPANSEQAKYNIFTQASPAVSLPQPFYKTPRSEAGAISNYFTADNSIDNSLNDAAGNPLLPTLAVQDFGNLFQNSWANSLIYYHPEYTKLKVAETTLASSYAWMDKVQFIDKYSDAQNAGVVALFGVDPYFINNYSTTDKTNMLAYISQHTPGGNTPGTNPSIWQIANGNVLCATTPDNQKNGCILGTTAGALDPRITGTDADRAWQRFKSIYFSYRNEMVAKYIDSRPAVLSASSMANLQAEGKQLVFATSQNVANQNGAGNMWNIAANASIPADTAKLHDSANAYIVRNNLNPDKCVAQRPFWAARLMQCEQLMNILNKNRPSDTARVNGIINTILDGMVSVCHNSQTALQPYGATTVNPVFTGTPQSFEAVVNKVFADSSIINNDADSNYFCNPFSVDAPKPFGTNTPLFVNYATYIDSCNCSRFATLKQEALAAGGYNTTTLAGMNQFLSAVYHDTLTLTLWQALQNCSLLYTDTCSHTTLLKSSGTGSLAAYPAISSVAVNNTVDFSQPNTCLIYAPLPLPLPTVIPAFLNCGYQKPCISCAQLDALNAAFRQLYPNYAGVPYMDSLATDAQTSQNNLWARFLNYRTGFSLNSLDYMTAYKNCFGSATGYIGNGADCGPASAVDSLLVNSRTAPNTILYTARKTIVFQNSFESNANDEFTAALNPALDSCVSNNGIAGTPIGGSGGNSNAALCAFDKPLNDIAAIAPPDTVPCRQAQTQTQFLAQLVYGKLKDSLTANFDSLYRARCMGAKNIEQFYASYQPAEYHYTLYFYDQAGNLVKTLPPAAVKPNFDAAYLASVQSQRLAATDASTLNNELLATHYRYNSLNQVMAQKTPDGGLSQFWYDRVGRLAISQNDKQLALNHYSYTQYDPLGRIIEVGERGNIIYMTQAISQDTTALKNWFTAPRGFKEQMTFTFYDQPYTSIAVSGNGVTGLYQQNLRNRVSYSMVFDNETQRQLLNDGTTGNGVSATFYSYDIHGNVDTLLQDYRLGIMANHGNRFKKIVYSYDLISGKVNDVAYQAGYADAFYHHYIYDAENRITNVNTSTDKMYWENEASYEYYRHGPLARTVLGQNQVQGMDYAYTIQGWLKGVNNNYLFADDEMSQDGKPGTSNALIARDAFAYTLGYFANDYVPVGPAATSTAFASQYLFSANFHAFPQPLYNGNISNIQMAVHKLGNDVSTGYTYRYDQLNRLVNMQSVNTGNGGLNGVGSNWDSFNNTSGPYNEAISYDPNGNIKTYLRNGQSPTNGGDNAMDNLTYQYERNAAGLPISNKLRYVHDQVADGNYPNDINSQTTLALAAVQADTTSGVLPGDNYKYDAIGNLIKDAKENIGSVDWSVYGKIRSITKTTGGGIQYTYDAAGNRISKTVNTPGINDSTFYVRDATGNVMAVYNSYNKTVGQTNQVSLGLLLTELHMYGSSRLGVYNQNTNLDVQSPQGAAIVFTRGYKFFELSNHLGNVLATISDKKIPHSTDGTNIDYYNADVVTANDYYPFGMQMPGRSYTQPNNNSYRYGFNGKENDNEVKGEGNQQDYGMRIYDPRLGRFLSVDPLTKAYPWYSPYQFAGNSPLANIDLDGAEPKPATSGTGEGQPQITTETQYAPSDCNCTEAEGYQVSKTWYWHEGSKDYGTKAGWYESKDYAKTLKPIAKDLAGYENKYNGVPGAGHNWTDAERANVANTPLGKFVMAGLTEDGEKHLSASAQLYANQANFNTTGTVYPSSFNVEDMLGVGLLVKGGFKGLASITTRGLGKTSGTVWEDILATQANYPGSMLPKSFELSVPNGTKVWVHGNATEHIAEFIAMKAVNYAPGSVRLATQIQLSSLQAAVNTATKNGVIYNQLMNIGGWELRFALPKGAGQLPALIHALPK